MKMMEKWLEHFFEKELSFIKKELDTSVKK